MPRTLGDSFIHVSSYARGRDRPSRPRAAAWQPERRCRRPSARTSPSSSRTAPRFRWASAPSRTRCCPTSVKQRPRHSHRDVLRRPDRSVREGVITNAPRPSTAARSSLRSSWARGRLRLHRQQPVRRVPPQRLHQRPLHHRPERPDGGDQLGHRDRSHRSGLRRLDRPADLQRFRRPGRLRPRRRALAGRQGDHRRCRRRRRGHGVAHRRRSPKAPASSLRAPTCTTSRPSSVSRVCSARACASAPKR